MLAQVLLPCSTRLELKEAVVEDEMITVAANSQQPDAECPKCHQPSTRIHSRYGRIVADLPCAERRVRLHLQVRRFFCDNAACERRTLAERFPGIVAPYARRTSRLAAIQRLVGLALGGEAGVRVLIEVAMPTSGDTILRLIRDAPQEEMPTPRVLGVDDWAWCKGQRYGTILVDLERHCVVDLLPDRSAETLAAWLRDHPGIEIISRDRAGVYIKGINQGAPDAIQVADRWHLLRNLRDALIRILEQNRACLYAAAAKPDDHPELESPAEADMNEEKKEDPLPTKSEQRQQATRERRLARYQTVIDLYDEGMKIREIARELGMGRGTVRRYIKAGSFPEMARRRKRGSILDPFLPYLEKRWAEGCHNGLQLYREIEKQGYSGSRPLVSRWAAQVRKQDPRPAPDAKALTKPKKRAIRPWSARYAVWLLLSQPETLSDEKNAALKRMLAVSPMIPRVYNFAQAFIQIVRERHSKSLEPWLTAVTEYKIPELSGFARSLNQDKDAVLAALSLPWSNGQVEGQVNRLKLIKRQMYGRAKFDLLRLRVLDYSGP
jgi:transposase